MWKDQAMIAMVSLESRIAYLLAAGCAAAKKCLESDIHTLDNVLQDLGIELGQFWIHLLACGQFRTLMSEAKGDTRPIR